MQDPADHAGGGRLAAGAARPPMLVRRGVEQLRQQLGPASSRGAPTRRADCTSGTVSSTAAEVDQDLLRPRDAAAVLRVQPMPRPRRNSNFGASRPWSSDRSEPSTAYALGPQDQRQRQHSATADAAEEIRSPLDSATYTCVLIAQATGSGNWHEQTSDQDRRWWRRRAGLSSELSRRRRAWSAHGRARDPGGRALSAVSSFPPAMFPLARAISPATDDERAQRLCRGRQRCHRSTPCGSRAAVMAPAGRRDGTGAADRRRRGARPISATATPACCLPPLRARVPRASRTARCRRTSTASGGEAAVGAGARLSRSTGAPETLEPSVAGPDADRRLQHHDPEPADRHAVPARPRRPRADARGSVGAHVPDRPLAVPHHQQPGDPARRRHQARPLQRHPRQRSRFRPDRGRDRAALVRQSPASPISAAPISATTSRTRSCRSAASAQHE